MYMCSARKEPTWLWVPFWDTVGAPPILVYVSGDCDVHYWGYGLLTHGHLFVVLQRVAQCVSGVCVSDNANAPASFRVEEAASFQIWGETVSMSSRDLGPPKWALRLTVLKTHRACQNRNLCPGNGRGVILASV